jgi:hypothetical protein
VGVFTPNREQTVDPTHLTHLADAAASLAGPIPTPEPSAPPGLEELGNTVISWLKWILAICGVAGLMFCGIMMTIGRRNRSAMAADGAAGIPWVLGGLSCALVAAPIVAVILGL